MTPGIDSAQIFWRLVVSMLLGGAIGIEREIHGKSAGLRTHMLVALGSCLFTVLSFLLPSSNGFGGEGEPTRIAAQIITGVGFLGAGTIIQGRGGVHGLTTAASIWLVAAIGMAAGAGFHGGAVVATVLGVLVLLAVYQIEEAIVRRLGSRYVVTALLKNAADVSDPDQLLEEMKLQPTRWQIERKGRDIYIRVEGSLRATQLKTLLNALKSRYELSELRVDRG